MGLWIKETFVNATANHMIGIDPWYETRYSDRGALFRSLQKEYGRAVAMHSDVPGQGFIGSHTASNVGWVFTKRMRYEDARGNGPDDHYIREVWVSVRAVPPGQYDAHSGGRNRRRRATPKTHAAAVRRARRK